MHNLEVLAVLLKISWNLRRPRVNLQWEKVTHMYIRIRENEKKREAASQKEPKLIILDVCHCFVARKRLPLKRSLYSKTMDSIKRKS